MNRAQESCGQHQAYQDMYNECPRRRERGRKNIWKDNGQKFPKFDERFESRCSRSWTTSKWNKPKRPIPRHYNQTVESHWQRILKAAREKRVLTYMRSLIRLTTDFSPEIMEARRQADDIYKVLKNIFSQKFYNQHCHSLEHLRSCFLALSLVWLKIL